MPADRTPSRVLVVGAGIAGLATALSLARSGRRVTVVERAPALRGGAYMINFSGLGYDAADRVGLLPTLHALQPRATDLVYLDAHGARTGVLPVATQQSLLGPRQVTLLRGDLERVLHDALPAGVELRFATTVTGIDQHGDQVHVQLSDGTHETVDLLVGADGLHSPTRELAFGPVGSDVVALRDLGHVVATYLIDPVPASIPTGATLSMGMVGRNAAVYPVRGTRVAAFFAFPRPPGALRPEHAREELHRAFGDLPHPVPDLLAALDQTDSVYYDQVAQVAMHRWSCGRVVLVGDAAWCVSLYAGFGSSLAVGGADQLVRELDRHVPTSVALQAWEHRLRPLVERKQRQGRRARTAFVAPNELALRLQRLMTGAAGSRAGAALLRHAAGLTGG